MRLSEDCLVHCTVLAIFPQRLPYNPDSLLAHINRHIAECLVNCAAEPEQLLTGGVPNMFPGRQVIFIIIIMVWANVILVYIVMYTRHRLISFTFVYTCVHMVKVSVFLYYIVCTVVHMVHSVSVLLHTIQTDVIHVCDIVCKLLCTWLRLMLRRYIHDYIQGVRKIFYYRCVYNDIHNDSTIAIKVAGG